MAIDWGHIEFSPIGSTLEVSVRSKNSFHSSSCSYLHVKSLTLRISICLSLASDQILLQYAGTKHYNTKHVCTPRFVTYFPFTVGPTSHSCLHALCTPKNKTWLAVNKQRQKSNVGWNITVLSYLIGGRITHPNNNMLYIIYEYVSFFPNKNVWNHQPDQWISFFPYSLISSFRHL
jgi:hypothetical protein